jgi:hypothetical protein
MERSFAGLIFRASNFPPPNQPVITETAAKKFYDARICANLDFIYESIGRETMARYLVTARRGIFRFAICGESFLSQGHEVLFSHG